MSCKGHLHIFSRTINRGVECECKATKVEGTFDLESYLKSKKFRAFNVIIRRQHIKLVGNEAPSTKETAVVPVIAPGNLA